MHPSDETLAARLNGKPVPGLESHLASCPACARRLEGMAAWNRELSHAFGEEVSNPEAERRMRAALPRRAPWRWAAAAAVLLAAGGAVLLRDRSEPVQASRPDEAGLRLESSESGAELILVPGSAVERKGDGHWILSSGACLASAPARVSVGSRTVDILDGEAQLRILSPSASTSLLRDAWAAEPAFEVAVLSGRVEVTGGLAAKSGEVLRSDGSLRALATEDRIFLLPASGGAFPLDGGRGRAARTQPLPSADYLVRVRIRGLDTKARFGLVFEVDGRPSLWVPEGFAPDGAWHALEARVSPAWVTLVLDGIALHRVPRRGFKPNPAGELRGAGPAVWNGRAQAEDLRLVPLR